MYSNTLYVGILVTGLKREVIQEENEDTASGAGADSLLDDDASSHTSYDSGMHIY